MYHPATEGLFVILVFFLEVFTWDVQLNLYKQPPVLFNHAINIKMSAINDARSVSQKIRGHYDEKFRAALEGLAQAHLAAALDHFHRVQPSQQGRTGRFWTNQTSDAANRVFGEVFSSDKAVGFFIAHGVEYGIYLELANNRQNEALRPLVEIYGNQYIMAVEEVLKP